MWVIVEVEMSDLRFLSGGEMPEPDFRVHSVGGNFTLAKIELRLC
jgi:hypothetical protein